jgi:predicted phage terminase large subunit-like protein
MTPRARHSNKIIAATLRGDLYSFVQAAFPIVAAEHKLLRNWHIEAMTYALTRVLNGEIKRLIITVPPRSLKSICASVALPAFALGHDSSRKFICVSYAQGLAEKHANDCRALMQSPMYRRVFTTRISPVKDTQQEFATTAGGYRYTTSVGGTLTGRGGNFIVLDDPMKPQDVYSDIARKHLIQWHSNTLLSRLDNKADDTIVVVMQRLHDDDFVAYLLDQGGWTHLNLPAVAETEQRVQLGPQRWHLRKRGDVLHPEREPLSVLKELERSMGSMDYAAQYQQTPVAEGGNFIKRIWFPRYDQPPCPAAGDRIIVSWDTALSAKELSSYSACVVIQVRGESAYVLDVFRDRLEYPELKRKVIELHRRWRPYTNSYALLIEKMGSGMSLIQDLKREHIHAVAILPKEDKVIRMNAQTARLQAGSVLLPRNAPWLDDFFQEVLAFPASRYSDQIDAFSQALNYAFNRPSFEWTDVGSGVKVFVNGIAIN